MNLNLPLWQEAWPLHLPVISASYVLAVRLVSRMMLLYHSQPFVVYHLDYCYRRCYLWYYLYFYYYYFLHSDDLYIVCHWLQKSYNKIHFCFEKSFRIHHNLIFSYRHRQQKQYTARLTLTLVLVLTGVQSRTYQIGFFGNFFSIILTFLDQKRKETFFRIKIEWSKAQMLKEVIKNDWTSGGWYIRSYTITTIEEGWFMYLFIHIFSEKPCSYSLITLSCGINGIPAQRYQWTLITRFDCIQCQRFLDHMQKTLQYDAEHQQANWYGAFLYFRAGTGWRYSGICNWNKKKSSLVESCDWAREGR